MIPRCKIYTGVCVENEVCDIDYPTSKEPPIDVTGTLEPGAEITDEKKINSQWSESLQLEEKPSNEFSKSLQVEEECLNDVKGTYSLKRHNI